MSFVDLSLTNCPRDNNKATSVGVEHLATLPLIQDQRTMRSMTLPAARTAVNPHTDTDLVLGRELVCVSDAPVQVDAALCMGMGHCV